MAFLYVIKMIRFCECQGCKDMLDDLRKIDGVEVKMDEERKVTISITKDLRRVTKKLEEHSKKFELIDQSASKNPGPEIHERRMVVARAPGNIKALEVVEEKIGKVGNCPKCDHVMMLKSYDKLFQCHGCYEKGFGPRYRCEHCGHDLHEVCMSPNHTISPEIFPGRTFVFVPSPPNRRVCDVCAKDIRGHSYHYDATKLDLHPCCSNLKAKECIGGTDFVLLDKFSSSSSTLPKCKRCNHRSLLGDKDRNQGCSYISTGDNNRVHVYCITKLRHESWKTEYINGATDYFVTELEKNKSKKGGVSGGSGFWNTLSMFVSTVVACLLGNPITVLVPFLSGIFLKSVPKFLKY